LPRGERLRDRREFQRLFEHRQCRNPGRHAADIAEDVDTDPIACGLEAIASGFSLRYPDDEENLARQFEVYDALYAWCRLHAA